MPRRYRNNTTYFKLPWPVFNKSPKLPPKSVSALTEHWCEGKELMLAVFSGLSGQWSRLADRFLKSPGYESGMEGLFPHL